MTRDGLSRDSIAPTDRAPTEINIPKLRYYKNEDRQTKLSHSFSDHFCMLPLALTQWHLEKDKDGIKVYTRPEPGSKFNAFKGETEVLATMDAVSAMIEDVEQFDEWDKDVKEIGVLERQPGKMLNYYVVYDLPWPIRTATFALRLSFPLTTTMVVYAQFRVNS
ncbi:MAG: hypothetical protein MZV65_38540 [Chromatiales bacterium]|nr:hypothetical protein [Chromatiales bacterium]